MPATTKDTIFVTGGTGTQGSATIRALVRLSSPNTVAIHALVRDPDSPSAQALARLSPSVKLFQGDYDSPTAIASAAEACTACFFVLLTGWNDAEAERRHAQNILLVLSSIPTLKRVVYTTTAGVKDPSVGGNFTNMEKDSLHYTYYEGKYANEAAVRKAAEQNGWAWTIVKPSTFLSNLLYPMARFQYPQLGEHRIVTVAPADEKYYWTDPDDVGQFSAVALLGPGDGQRQCWPDLSNQTIEVASQVGLLSDATSAMEKAVAKAKQGSSDVKITIEHITPDEAEKRGFSPMKTKNEQFVVDNPPKVDMNHVRSFGLELGTIDGFFEREVEKVKEVLALL